MAEDESESSPEELDVKAKLAKMSGTRLRKQRAERAAEKKATSNIPERETEDLRELERAAKKAKQIQELLDAEPSEPAVVEPGEAEAQPAPEPARKRPRKETPYPKDDEDSNVAAPIGFVIGLLGGCLPAIVSLVTALSASAPEGLPAEAVERERDWVHCTKAVSANRWACDVFDYSGNPIGRGEFVPAADGQGTDWRPLAKQDSLAIDGDYENLGAHTQMTYVEGVAVSSKRVWGKK